MDSNYTFKALEDVITIKLNPLKNPVNKLSEIEIAIIERTLADEFNKLQTSLVDQVFKTPKETRIRVIVNFYHDELITLTNEVYKKREYFPVTNKILYHAYNTMIGGLDEVISFIELRFSNYIILSKKAPATYLIVAKNELALKTREFRARLIAIVPVAGYAELVLKAIQDFIDTPVEKGPVTFKEVLYMKELVSQLELLDDPEHPGCIYTALTELLVNLNFNNKPFINFITHGIKQQVSSLPSLELQHQQLAFKRKEFSQMHQKPGVCYDPQLPDLKVQVDRWFTHEIHYVEQEMKVPKTTTPNVTEPKLASSEEKFKLLCLLTGDQIGLLLRALEFNRVIVAPNKKAVFEAIVPYLSTREKTELSPGNTRAKSYDGSDHDKQIAVKTLEKLIKTISEF